MSAQPPGDQMGSGVISGALKSLPTHFRRGWAGRGTSVGGRLVGLFGGGSLAAEARCARKVRHRRDRPVGPLISSRVRPRSRPFLLSEGKRRSSCRPVRSRSGGGPRHRRHRRRRLHRRPSAPDGRPDRTLRTDPCRRRRPERRCPSPRPRARRRRSSRSRARDCRRGRRRPRRARGAPLAVVCSVCGSQPIRRIRRGRQRCSRPRNSDSSRPLRAPQPRGRVAGSTVDIVRSATCDVRSAERSANAT